MISELDEVLRQFLIRELPIRNSEVEVKFDQPRREWSSRLSHPTLNLFLYDLRENGKLRQPQPVWEVIQSGDDGVTRRRRPVRMDLNYMITAWAQDPGDEHRMLSRTLMAFFRHPNLPQELLPDSMQDQPAPIPVMVAQEDEFRNPADVWSALDNEIRPAIICTVTLAINPYEPVTTPMVQEREVKVRNT